MRAPGWSFLRAPAVLLSLLLLTGGAAGLAGGPGPRLHRRILHQPLFPAGSAPPPAAESLHPPPPSPPPPSPAFPDPDQPFFPEVPAGATQNPGGQLPLTLSNATTPFPTASQPTKPTKTVATAISVGIITLGMLSALAFFLYRHRAKHPQETQKLVSGNNSERGVDDS